MPWCHILQNFYPRAMRSYHRHGCLLLFLSFSIASYSQTSVTTRFDRRFHRNYFSERSYYRYIPLCITWSLSTQWNSVAFHRIFIPAKWCRINVTFVYCCFCNFLLLHPIGRVWPLVLITNSIGITLLSDHITHFLSNDTSMLWYILPVMI